MCSLKQYIYEAISSGKSGVSYKADFTIDGICEWLRDLGLKNVDIRQEPGYELYVDEETGNIVVRAKIRRSGKIYVLDAWFGTDSPKGNFLSIELYEDRRKTTYTERKTISDTKDMYTALDTMKEFEKLVKK